MTLRSAVRGWRCDKSPPDARWSFCPFLPRSRIAPEWRGSAMFRQRAGHSVRKTGRSSPLCERPPCSRGGRDVRRISDTWAREAAPVSVHWSNPAVSVQRQTRTFHFYVQTWRVPFQPADRIRNRRALFFQLVHYSIDQKQKIFNGRFSACTLPAAGMGLPRFLKIFRTWKTPAKNCGKLQTVVLS